MKTKERSEGGNRYRLFPPYLIHIIRTQNGHGKNKKGAKSKPLQSFKFGKGECKL